MDHVLFRRGCLQRSPISFASRLLFPRFMVLCDRPCGMDSILGIYRGASGVREAKGFRDPILNRIWILRTTRTKHGRHAGWVVPRSGDGTENVMGGSLLRYVTSGNEMLF